MKDVYCKKCGSNKIQVLIWYDMKDRIFGDLPDYHDLKHWFCLDCGKNTQIIEENKMTDKLIINGRYYPLWSQFIERKEEWFGGILEDIEDPEDIQSTKIISIDLRSNGVDSAYFEVKGERFSCGFDVKFGGMLAGKKDWITFSGYNNHEWRIKQPEKQT